MTWLSIIVAGILTYITRMTMVTLVDRKVLSTKLKQVLSYVPAAVFPAIIFPAVLLNETGLFVDFNNPKIFGAAIAIIVGYIGRNVIATILSGLVSYWTFIFLVSLN